MTERDPSDFTGGRSEREDETSESDMNESTLEADDSSSESDQDLGTVERLLSGANDRIDTARGIVAGYAPNGGSDGPDESVSTEQGDPDYNEEDGGRNRRELLAAAGAGAAGVAGIALAMDAADGEIGDEEYWLPDYDDDVGVAPTNNTTDRDDTPTPEDTDAATPEQTPDDTPQTPERGYQGEIDGSNYELEPVPGAGAVDYVPNNATGFEVEDDLLASYDPDGWREIESDEGYEELGPSTEWYVTEDAIIGVDTRSHTIWEFSPDDDFRYDTDELYTDIAQEAN